MCTIFELLAKDDEEDFKVIGANVFGTLDQEPVRGKAEAILMTVSLNACLSGMT